MLADQIDKLFVAQHGGSGGFPGFVTIFHGVTDAQADFCGIEPFR
jgi:hypothetical protein